MQQEKRLPANTQAEEGILSCLLYNPRNIVRVVDRLTSEHFADDGNATIYQAMVSLHQRGKSCTQMNVRDELLRRDDLERIGGELHLDHLFDSLATLNAIEDYVDTIVHISTNRRLYAAAARIAKAALSQDTDSLELAEQLIYEIAQGVDSDSVAPLSDVKTRYMQEFEQRHKNFRESIANGIPTGFHDLDEILGGLQPSNLYTFAARPSVGKTALALCIALYIVKYARRCLFFSLEMSESELFQRLLAMETPIDQSFLRDGDVNEQELEDIRYTADDLGKLDMLIDDRTYTLNGICSKARREHARKPLKLIVVDYLQLIDATPEGRGKNELRTEEVGKISKRLKRLAKELKIPVIAIAQLNRDVESRESPKPRMSDLGESGKLEQDLDIVAFVYCEKTELDKKEHCQPYKVHVNVAKHRNGRLGDVELWFRPRITKFQDEAPEGYDDGDSV